MFEAFKSRRSSAVTSALSRSRDVRTLIAACRQLLSEEGEASGTHRASETLALYTALDDAGRAAFFDALKRDFAPDPEAVLSAAHAYALEASSLNLSVLSRVAEPPRQELLRRMNRAPNGTRTIVGMRAHLLDALKRDPELSQVDDDFRHLLSSWFNPGFLKLTRVDWQSPASLLEQVIHHEAVHEIRDWKDLRRRLQQDRRLFAFFHPAMPDEPLIFVEVALLPSMAAQIGPLLVSDAAPEDASTFKTAVFYSISNCQPGLRGVSLGNFLIKQVVDVLTQEYQKLREFCTLSPIPGFRTWLKEHMEHGFGEDKRITPALRRSLTNVTQALRGDLPHSASELRAQEAALTKHERDLSRLCAAYLLGVGEPSGTSRDPVARFHLNNGAQLERLNVRADLSDKGLKQSLGMMVNYLYEPKRIERNHEQFVRGRTIASDDVEGLL